MMATIGARGEVGGTMKGAWQEMEPNQLAGILTLIADEVAGGEEVTTAELYAVS
jgi:hypothetical protein